jgi:hypothetical protein
MQARRCSIDFEDRGTRRLKGCPESGTSRRLASAGVPE